MMVVRKWLTVIAAAALLLSLLHPAVYAEDTQTAGNFLESVEPPPGFIDPLDTFSLAAKRTNLYLEGGNPAYYGGDTKRATRATTAAGYLTYTTPYDIESFAVHGYSYNAVPFVPLKLYVSKDGEAFTELEVTPVLSGEPVFAWQLYVYEAAGLPEGTRALKIELSGDSKSWTPQISQVLINRNTLSVTAEPPEGFIGSETLMVRLQTATPGASIYYRTEENAAYQLYTEPISLTKFTLLDTYAAAEWLQPSPARVYTYFALADIQIDRYGQRTSASFASKVTSDEELQADVAYDEAYYGALEAPAHFDSYGGLMGSAEALNLQAKGFFNIQHAQGKPVLVAPGGNVYFSNGVNAISNNETFTNVAGREQIYEWIPSYDSEYRAAFTGSKDNFSYYMANKYRKTGTIPTNSSFYAEAAERIRKWGFNSAGAWGSGEYARQNQLPYTLVLPLNSMSKPSEIKVFDIFAEGAEQQIDEALAKSLPSLKDDPLLIGYFVDNEYHYEKFLTTVPKLKASKTGLKRRFVQLLEEKYGDIATFNANWETSYAAFTELGEASLFIDTAAAAADIEAFFRLYLNTYYETVTRLFRQYDPNHLLLGDRWLTLPMQSTKIRGILAEEAGKYMDVISINHYNRNLDTDMLNDVYAKSGGKPILLSEWSYGTAEQGLNPIVLGAAATEEERMLRYRNYVEGAASLGYVVGTHWFDYVDQAATGRWFEGHTGESYNTGLINVADRPYTRFLEGVMETNNRVYDVLLGNAQPFRHDFGDSDPGPAPDNRMLDIPYVAEPGPIDGIASDLPGTAGSAILTEADLVAGNGAEGMTAGYQFAWDEQHLYVTASVTEPTPMNNPYRNSSLWKGDGIELFVGPDELAVGGDLIYSDRQLILSAGLTDGLPYWMWFNTGRQAEIDMAVAPVPDGTGYVLEAAIPWTSLKMSPQEGTKFLFDFGFDDSEDGQSRKRQWIWNGTNRNNLDRGLWGEARLTGPAVRETAEVDYTGTRVSRSDTAIPIVATIVTSSGQIAGAGLPVQFHLTAIGTNGERVPVEASELERIIETDENGTASVLAELPEGLYSVRAELLENDRYQTAYTEAVIAIEPAGGAAFRMNGFLLLAGNDNMGRGGEKLHVNSQIGGRGEDHWRLKLPGGEKLDVTMIEWAVTSGESAYWQGRTTLDGKPVTIRMAATADGKETKASIFVWEGEATSGEPILSVLDAVFSGRFSILK
ncbi:sugar-binding protein [Paenibacillus soyae]|uniref:Beta-galactosidase n=1 Tax=Paenibacillus soyae TaxID=2969249 RepID=A0A9X2MP54_9BACL|nr:sugar-binding protein [Paenibacillus soyae]MCR2805618.1 beta-galactosidase [Paenibacillus soyae]